MTIDRSIDVSGIDVPEDYQEASNAELIRRLTFIRDNSLSMIIGQLKDGRMKGTSALSELADRACKLIESASTTSTGNSEDIRIHFLDTPWKDALVLFANAIKQNTATGAPIWNDILEADYTTRNNKAELLDVFEAARENAQLRAKQ